MKEISIQESVYSIQGKTGNRGCAQQSRDAHWCAFLALQAHLSVSPRTYAYPCAFLLCLRLLARPLSCQERLGNLLTQDLLKVKRVSLTRLCQTTEFLDERLALDRPDTLHRVRLRGHVTFQPQATVE